MAFIYLRETKLLILAASVITGLAVVYFSQNRAAWGLFFVAAPIFAFIGFLFSRHLSSNVLRFSAVTSITLTILVLTTIVSVVDFQSYAQKFVSYKGGTIGTKIHSALNSQVTRHNLQALSFEAILYKPNTLAVGQGWGMFGDHFATHMPTEWVKIRDESEVLLSESENWIKKSHWDAINRVDFHSHNGFTQVILSAGIIGVLLFLGILLAPVIWCRKKIIILAGTFGFATAGLYAQWFLMPPSLPLFALALGGFVTPVKFKWFFPNLKILVPYIATGISILLLFIGMVSLNFTNYAYFYQPKMTAPLITPEGRFVCSSRFEDQDRGGLHLAHRLKTMAIYVKRKINIAEAQSIDPNLIALEHYLIDEFRGTACAAENYIDRGASIRLLIAALQVKSDFAFLILPNKLKPIVDRLLQNWGTRVKQLVARAPKRTDLAVPYLLYLLKIGDEKNFSNLATTLFATNSEDPIALWFSGIDLLSKPNMGQVGTQRMKEALLIGVERLMPVDPA